MALGTAEQQIWRQCGLTLSGLNILAEQKKPVPTQADFNRHYSTLIDNLKNLMTTQTTDEENNTKLMLQFWQMMYSKNLPYYPEAINDWKAITIPPKKGKGIKRKQKSLPQEKLRRGTNIRRSKFLSGITWREEYTTLLPKYREAESLWKTQLAKTGQLTAEEIQKIRETVYEMNQLFNSAPEHIQRSLAKERKECARLTEYWALVHAKAIKPRLPLNSTLTLEVIQTEEDGSFTLPPHELKKYYQEERMLFRLEVSIDQYFQQAKEFKEASPTERERINRQMRITLQRFIVLHEEARVNRLILDNHRITNFAERAHYFDQFWKEIANENIAYTHDDQHIMYAHEHLLKEKALAWQNNIFLQFEEKYTTTEAQRENLRGTLNDIFKITLQREKKRAQEQRAQTSRLRCLQFTNFFRFAFGAITPYLFHPITTFCVGITDHLWGYHQEQLPPLEIPSILTSVDFGEIFDLIGDSPDRVVTVFYQIKFNLEQEVDTATSTWTQARNAIVDSISLYILLPILAHTWEISEALTESQIAKASLTATPFALWILLQRYGYQTIPAQHPLQEEIDKRSQALQEDQIEAMRIIIEMMVGSGPQQPSLMERSLRFFRLR